MGYRKCSRLMDLFGPDFLFRLIRESGYFNVEPNSNLYDK